MRGQPDEEALCARREGDAPPAGLTGPRARRLAVAAALVSALLFGAYALIGAAGLAQAENGTLAIDFVVFWSAAKLALAGAPLAVFDAAAFGAAQGVDEAFWFPWVYPPGFLLLVLPLGALSFGAAWLAFTGASLGALGLALRAFSGRAWPVWLMFFAAPAFLPGLVLGQTSTLWAAGLLGALALLRGGRPVLAGVLIGCLTLKPQLGLMIPVALLAARRWDTVAAAAITAAALLILPTVALGLDYWSAFMEASRAQLAFLKGGEGNFDLMPSLYALLRGGPWGDGAAMAAQAVGMAYAFILVWRIWRREEACFDLKAAALTASIPLSSPYLWYYDSAFVALTALFLLRAGGIAPRGAGLVLLGVLWLGPGATSLAQLLWPAADLPTREYMLAEIILAWFAVARADSQRKSGPEGGPGRR